LLSSSSFSKGLRDPEQRYIIALQHRKLLDDCETWQENSLKEY